MPTLYTSPIFVRSSTVGAADPGREPWGADLDRVADAFSRIVDTTSRLAVQANRDFRNEALTRRLVGLVNDADRLGDEASATFAKTLAAAVARATAASGGSGPVSLDELASYFGRGGTIEIVTASSGVQAVSKLGQAMPFVTADLALTIAHLRESIADLAQADRARTLMSAAREGDTAAVFAAQSVARWIVDEAHLDLDALRLTLRQATNPGAFEYLQTAQRWSDLLNANTRTFRKAVREACDVPTHTDPAAAGPSEPFDPLPARASGTAKK